MQLAPATNISIPELHEINRAVEFVLPIARDLGLNKERLDFVYRFVFPPSHAGLLPVRESMREPKAYEEQEFEKTKKRPQRFGRNPEESRREPSDQTA